MTKDLHCPMIHGGLNINLKEKDNTLTFNQCCLCLSQLQVSTDPKLLWNNEKFKLNRLTNEKNIWLDECYQCQRAENSGLKSFRQSMIEGLGVKKNLSGPQRIDLLFDRSCNLACRTCGPNSSTFWQKHLRDNNLPVDPWETSDNLSTITEVLKNLDLSNLRQVQFSGGETLMGNAYWAVAELIADLAPQARDQILLCFQTNATQPIHEKYYRILERFHLVKFMISIDGTHDRFEYLRWPARWNQVVDNIQSIREQAPSNVMFYVQECTSNLNMYYMDEVRQWLKDNFSTNRFGDPVEHSTQMAIHEYLNVNVITHEYLDAISDTRAFELINPDWHEDADTIRHFIQQTEKFDRLRGQDWKQTFPEVAAFYARYLK